MGRAFEKELSFLNNTFLFSLNRDTKSIELFLEKIFSIPLIVIGSGGSYSAAKVFEFFAQISGLSPVVKAMTPFELKCYPGIVKKNAFALLTAGGNNKDTVNVFKFIAELEPKDFLTICIRNESKIHNLVSEYSEIFFYDGAIPSGKDGYLAVNSLFSIITLLIKAFHNLFPNNNFFNIDSNIDFLDSQNDNIHNQNIEAIIKCRSFITLHGGMSTSAAFDLESKFSEVALGAVQLSDYRNFAHGRHYWISQNTSDTCVVMFISPNEENIAEATMRLIPKEIPIFIIRTKKNNVFGVLDLFYQVFQFTCILGRMRNVDPGRPKVKEYGKKLYHINYNFWSPQKINPYKLMNKRSAYRKCSTTSLEFNKYEQAFINFTKSVEKKRFQAVVFDYDGTLKNNNDMLFDPAILHKLLELLENNIRIGIATGRGKSVKSELRSVLPPQYWDNVIIAYYNGGAIAPLSNDSMPNINMQADPSLQSIYDELIYVFPNIKNIDFRPKQLTIIVNNHDLYSESIEIAIREICAKYSNIKAWKSGHSIDIVTADCSKLNIIKYFNDSNVLTIGDSGGFGGNDYELLSTPYSLSVNKVSNSFESCWNCAPLGIKGPDATRFYLYSLLNITEREFSLHFSM